MVDPVASVIIPTHNRDIELARAASSALAQSIPNIEVIVINDASTDQTKEVLAVLEAMDDRLRVLHLPIPLGLSGGLQRNEGIKAARGKFICYVDDDDVMTYRSVQDRMEFLEEHEELDFCWGRTFFIRNNVFKAANGLGIKLPSGMFASERGASSPEQWEAAGTWLDEGANGYDLKKLVLRMKDVMDGLKEAQRASQNLRSRGVGRTEDGTLIVARVVPPLRELARFATKTADKLERQFDR